MKLLFILVAVAILVIGGIMSFSTWTRPKPLSLRAASLKLSVVTVDGEQCVAVKGPPINSHGAHQYLAYSVDDNRIELAYFVTRIAFPNRGAFQADWPLLIPQSKFLSGRVRLTCKARQGEEVIATILKTNDLLEIQQDIKP